MGKHTRIDTPRKKIYSTEGGKRMRHQEKIFFFFLSISKIKVMDERLDSWLVLSLSKFPILPPHHN